MATEITLSSPQSMGIEAISISANVNSNVDVIGSYRIVAKANCIVPVRTEVEGLKIQENHTINCRLEVTPEEIAEVADVAVGAVGGLSGNDLRSHATTIALGKVLTALGLSV